MSAAFWAVSTLCLFVAMYRAWLREHRRANAAEARATTPAATCTGSAPNHVTRLEGALVFVTGQFTFEK